MHVVPNQLVSADIDAEKISEVLIDTGMINWLILGDHKDKLRIDYDDSDVWPITIRISDDDYASICRKKILGMDTEMNRSIVQRTQKARDPLLHMDLNRREGRACPKHLTF